MGVNIIDKRPVKRDRAVENRQRFLKRIKQTIKDQLPYIIQKKSLKDLGSTGGRVTVKKKSLSEPTWRHGKGGEIDTVITGNDRWVVGDMEPKPIGGSGGVGNGREAGRGKSEDDFIIELSKDEFLNYFFEDLELPDMIQMELSKLKLPTRENAGFQVDGSPNRLSVVRSYKQSMARRLPIIKTIDTEIANLSQLAVQLQTTDEIFDQLIKIGDEEIQLSPVDKTNSQYVCELLIKIEKRITYLEDRKKKLPMFEDVDLRYRCFVKKETPIAHATMIMIMDNSGSMQIREKTIARKFFWLLYSFLNKEYDEVELIFISHTDEAREMSEEEFFNTTESGGTVVSTALDLAAEIIREELVGKTNIYVAQVSDGDNDRTDNGTCSEILEDEILPYTRYYSYIQVDNYHDEDAVLSPSSLMTSGLWASYDAVCEKFKNMQIKRVAHERDIYPVFRELFKKKDSK